jgi:hypothetical protein
MTNLSTFSAQASAIRADASPASAPASAPVAAVNAPPQATTADFRPLEGAYPRIGRPEDALPLNARQKFERLSQEADELHILFRAASDAMLERTDDVREIEAALRHQRNAPARFWNLSEIERLEAKLAAAKREQVERQTRYNARAAASMAKRRVVTALREFIEANGARLRDAEPVELPVTKTPLVERLEAQRAKIADLKADRQAVKDAPKPSSIAKAHARQVIEELAARGAPNPMIALETDSPFQFQGAEVIPAGVQLPLHRVDLLATIVWAVKETILEKAEALIDDAADDASALSAMQKRERITAIDRDLLAAERIEESLIEAAIACGVNVDRRADASPLAILGVEK